MNLTYSQKPKQFHLNQCIFEKAQKTKPKNRNETKTNAPQKKKED